MSKASTKKPARPKGDTGVPGKRPSRSKRIRPQSAEDLALAIRQDNLDCRTSAARHILEARRAIDAAPLDTSRALLVDSLAQNTAILAAISRELSKPGVNILTQGGELNPLVGESLFAAQDALRRTVTLLVKLESKCGTNGPEKANVGKKDLAALILEADDVKGPA